jgi:hypothetical protein
MRFSTAILLIAAVAVSTVSARGRRNTACAGEPCTGGKSNCKIGLSCLCTSSHTRVGSGKKGICGVLGQGGNQNYNHNQGHIHNQNYGSQNHQGNQGYNHGY